jgi:hypothetical protein
MEARHLPAFEEETKAITELFLRRGVLHRTGFGGGQAENKGSGTSEC